MAVIADYKTFLMNSKQVCNFSSWPNDEHPVVSATEAVAHKQSPWGHRGSNAPLLALRHHSLGAAVRLQRSQPTSSFSRRRGLWSPLSPFLTASLNTSLNTRLLSSSSALLSFSLSPLPLRSLCLLFHLFAGCLTLHPSFSPPTCRPPASPW